MSFKYFVQITKPGIIFGNVISVMGGFFLASRGHFDYFLFLSAVTGTSLIVASGCICNNYIDRDIDIKMQRTKKRVLVQGLLSPFKALTCAFLLGLIGFIILYLACGSISAYVSVIGFAVYVGLYSIFLKRNSVYGTFIGSISGATPPIIGYVSVSETFDLASFILLVIFSVWQMPHSYAIAIFRFEDYLAASIPVLPVKQGFASAQRHIVFYIILFLTASSMLTFFGYTGMSFIIVMSIISSYWLYIASVGYKIGEEKKWSRKIFLISIFTITSLSLMISIDFTSYPSAIRALEVSSILT